VRLVVGDAETFFDRKNKYSLSVMTQEEYLRDPRFEMHGIAIKWDKDTLPVWYDEREWRYIAKEEDWSDVFFLAHHNAFDASILNWHYDVRPRMLGCTMSMGKLLLGAHISVSLDSMRKHFGIPAKITPYGLFDGKRWSELSQDVREQIGNGAIDEVESIYKMFTQYLAPQFPAEEYEVVDTIIRMFSEPVLRLDAQLLAKVWQEEALKKQHLLAQLGVQETELQSADKFAELLRAEGIEPSTKTGPVSKRTGKSKDNYAFAAKDDFMKELLESDNERVSTLAAARLGVKSTITQTRAESLGWISSRGPLPIYLNYAGAGTLRVTGGGSINPLNFKRNSDIRRSICAPEGFVLAPVDSSQIECRCVNYLAGQWDIIERFRDGKDPYTGIASQFYGEEIYKPAKGDPRKEEMEMKRGTGKQAELSCGYGSSGETFKKTAALGIYGPPVKIPLEDANRIVALYRETHPAICAKNTGYWAQAGRMIARLAGGDPIQWGPLLVKDSKIILPNGCPVIYTGMEFYHPTEEELPFLKDFEMGGYWRMPTRFGWKKMWGSKIVQNVCEAVSRVIVSQAMIRIKSQYGFRTLNWPYDELLLLLPKDGNEECNMKLCEIEMKREVPWLPGLPLDCEGIIGDRYAK